MTMNWKLLSPALFAPAALLVATLGTTGCETCVGEECDFDGIGGDDGGGGAGSDGDGGSDSGMGGDGTGGSTMSVIECTSEATGSDEVALPDATSCDVCVKEKCAAEQTECLAVNPDHACAWGTVIYDGTEHSESTCMVQCFTDRNDAGSFVGTPTDDVDPCAEECGASECASETITQVTEDLALCILGYASRDDASPGLGCLDECGLAP